MTVRIFPNGRVVCQVNVPIPLSASMAWGQPRDFQTSATHDPFHAVIQIDGNIPRAGATLIITHRYLFWHTVRVGKILCWQEGKGFAFSDLCQTYAGRAFPHVLRYQLEPVSEKSCLLKITVGGRWTAGVPRWIGQLWLWWVFSHVARTAQNQLLGFALAIKGRVVLSKHEPLNFTPDAHSVRSSPYTTSSIDSPFRPW